MISESIVLFVIMILFQIGDDVVDPDGFLGSITINTSFIGKVAYIGPICVSKPSITWIGVIWKNAGRGKNNGSLVGEDGIHTYFQCDDNFGSFLQPAKLKKCISIQEAFHLK